MLLREQLEQLESERLSPYAAKSAQSKGRMMAEERCSLRTDYQRDRDRIIHSKSFRRLMHKTQVFLAPEGDHFRTRLTHTLEVAQIARTCARALSLNEDLAEAIALGHDLGHTPFGHNGEAYLNERHPGGFAHNVQSLRVVDVLERNPKGRTMNLTWEVRDGILNHTGSGTPCTLEGQVVRVSDQIAYINHDIDDAFRAGVLCEQDLPREACAILGHNSPERITTLVNDMVAASAGQPKISMTPEIEQAMLALRGFMFERVYESASAEAEKPRAGAMVQAMFQHYFDHLDEVPSEYHAHAPGNPVQAVVDYVSGMTDRYAIRQYEGIFIPKVWRL